MWWRPWRSLAIVHAQHGNNCIKCRRPTEYAKRTCELKRWRQHERPLLPLIPQVNQSNQTKPNQKIVGFFFRCYLAKLIAIGILWKWCERKKNERKKLHWLQSLKGTLTIGREKTKWENRFFFFSRIMFTRWTWPSLLSMGLMLMSSTRQLHFKLGAAVVRAAQWKTIGQLCAFSSFFLLLFAIRQPTVAVAAASFHSIVIESNNCAFFAISSVNSTPNTLCSDGPKTLCSWRKKIEKKKTEKIAE